MKRHISCIYVALFVLVMSFGTAFGSWVKVEHLPLTDQGDQRSLLLMLDRQVNYLQAISSKNVRIGNIRVSTLKLLESAKAMRLIVLKYHGKPQFGLKVREKFDIYKAGNPQKTNKALFTGYYDPVVLVKKQRTDQYRFPIYRRPDDLRHSHKDDFFRVANGRKVPYYTRRDIDEKGVLRGKGYEIAWAADYVSVFYLMVQGSGTLQFTDGETRTIHFAASNGHPFKSAARACMNDGNCPGGYEPNLAWFRANPKQAFQYMQNNPRYIFFTTSNKPARGVAGIPLTPMRTIATDKRHYPPGAIALAKVPMPYIAGDGSVKIKTVSMIVADGDTGSAIKGPGRADFYYGGGKNAGKLAGKTHGWGELYYLIAK